LELSSVRCGGCRVVRGLVQLNPAFSTIRVLSTVRSAFRRPADDAARVLYPA